MRLTLYTDFALRVLIHVAVRPDRLCSISEMASAYGVSQNHLMKVVRDLGRAGYVENVRGRAGGVRLARPPQDISVGAIVRHTEEGLDLVDCESCVIAAACGLTGVLGKAMDAFLAVLDAYTLADLVRRRSALKVLLGDSRIPV